MNEGLPKLVLERLRATQSATHPDADLLTAFAERSLSTSERDNVLQHLAACPDCREIVALATPEQAVAPPPLPTQTSWLTWPYLRWGAALACVVVVGAAVTLRQQHPASQAKLEAAKVQETASLQANRQVSNEPAAPPRNEQDAVASLAKDQHKAAEVVRKAPAAPLPRPAEKQLTLQGRNYDSLQQLDGDKTRADSAPARAKEQNEVAVTGGAPAFQAENKKDSEDRQYLKMAPANTPPAAMSEAVAVTAAAPVASTDSASVQKAQGAASARVAARAPAGAAGKSNMATGDSRDISQLVVLDSSLGARWTLSPEGILQRSLDSGTTWTPVTVAPNVFLRAVSASGNDVWVGGAAGALFHSVDNGMHWTHVRPSFEGKLLTGDIIGLEFKDLAHGQVAALQHRRGTDVFGRDLLQGAR